MSLWGKQEDATAGPAHVAYVREVDQFVATIHNVRVVLLVLTGLGTVFVAAVFFVLAIPVLIYGAVIALMIHVVLGWLEHSLGLLTGIYMNTRPKPGGTVQ